jgi:NAD(P)-dependent dehydrogenase (short-subunit alcohol dehydrogenase family)
LARRFGQPEDIAHAIEFLMTNPYVTATTLTVDGGYVAI